MYKGIHIRSNLRLKNSETKSSIKISSSFNLSPSQQGQGEKKIKQGAEVLSQ